MPVDEQDPPAGAVPMPLALRTLDGEQYNAAADVTAMLRGFAETWRWWRASGQVDLDLATVATIDSAVTDFADQLDVECIALARGAGR
jgi:hypothetical protein